MVTNQRTQIFHVEFAQVAALPFLKNVKDVDFEIPVLESYDPERKVGFRSVGTCSCRICTVAKRNGLSVLQLSRKKRKRGRPTSKPVPRHIKICSNCFLTLAKGSNHTAVQCKNSKRTKIEKLVKGSYIYHIFLKIQNCNLPSPLSLFVQKLVTPLLWDILNKL